MGHSNAKHAKIFSHYLYSKSSKKEAEGVDISSKNDQYPMVGISDTLEVMRSGTMMTAYFVGRPKLNVFLFCRNGMLYICDDNEDELNQALLFIPLHSMMLLLIGKQTQALQEHSNQISGYCFSFKGVSNEQTVTLDLETTSKDLLKLWLRGIKELLELTKAEVHIVSPGILSITTTRQEKQLYISREKQNVLRQAKFAGSLLQMSAGMSMTAFSRNGLLKQVTLFCRNSKLYVSHQGYPLEDALLIFKLDSITDIYIGKQTQEFTTRVGKLADEAKCFSIVGKYSLHLETNSTLELNTWICGLQYLLQVAQKKLVFNETNI